MPKFNADYLDRVYAGVLGKVIGVYLGRPFEGWTYDSIIEKLGDIEYFVHDKLGQPLVVSDDDISGTFTFLRAVVDHDYPAELTARQIGQTWLNYLVEERTVLWWGGLGCSTEHTAYLRLKHGIPAPESGSIARNSRVVAEQIGAQIFIDGWGLINPGDPERAAWYARRAASVSHDGEAIYGAQVIAAMEAAAFDDFHIDRLLDSGLAQIPKDCTIARMIGDLRSWSAAEPDWRVTRKRLQAHYGYDKYGGGCHMVPNHGVIILAMLYGGGDFSKSLTIANTAGWDTDCNSGNVGCLLGVINGLAGIDAGPDWRGPVADRVLLPTADPGRCITDAASEAVRIANMGLRLADQPEVTFKNGARFHFELPGSVQGFSAEGALGAKLENVEGGSASGRRSLQIEYRDLSLADTVVVTTPTFMTGAQMSASGYSIMGSPTIFPGQTLRARVTASVKNFERIACGPMLRRFGADDSLVTTFGPTATLSPGMSKELAWTVPQTGGQPIAEIGIALTSGVRSSGSINLDYLTWDGIPDTTFARPAEGGGAWAKAWVDGASSMRLPWDSGFAVTQNEGTGLALIGAREWDNYRVSSTVSIHFAAAGGIAAHAQGMRRYYALMLVASGKLQLVKARETVSILAERDCAWEFDGKYELALEVSGNSIRALVDGSIVFDHVDDDRPLTEGAIGLICTEGRMTTDAVVIEPLSTALALIL